MPKRTRNYRIGLMDELRNPVAAAHYVSAALEDSDQMLLIALRDVAEARQMSRVAQDANVSRESLYRMLRKEGNPRYSSLVGILRAVGLRIAIEPDLPPAAGETATENALRISASVTGDVPTRRLAARGKNRST